jgi:hypothetical protein
MPVTMYLPVGVDVIGERMNGRIEDKDTIPPL